MSQGPADGPALQMVGDAALACGPEGCELAPHDTTGADHGLDEIGLVDEATVGVDAGSRPDRTLHRGT